MLTGELLEYAESHGLPHAYINEKLVEFIDDALKAGPLQVGTFYKKWTQRPDDQQCEGSYRKFLLELEAERKIEVLSNDLKHLKPVSSRRRSKGKPTLCKQYYVRLRK